MRTLWTFVPGLVLVAGALGLAGLRMHSEQFNGTIDCGSLISGMPDEMHPDIIMRRTGFVPGPTCATKRDSRTAEVAGVAGLGVLVLGGAGWVWRRDAPLRAARRQAPDSAESAPSGI
jgi:hypothetical protein